PSPATPGVAPADAPAPSAAAASPAVPRPAAPGPVPPPPAAAASGVHAAPLTYRSWQPGIVQLRPLSFGDFLTVPFRGFRFARATTLGGPLVMTLVSTAVGVLAGWLFLTDSQLGLLEPYPPMAGVEPLTIAVFVASIALWFASDMLASAMVMVGVSRARSEERRVGKERASLWIRHTS